MLLSLLRICCKEGVLNKEEGGEMQVEIEESGEEIEVVLSR